VKPVKICVILKQLTGEMEYIPRPKIEERGKVHLWRNQHDQVIGGGISNFLLVKCLKHNLLIISQLCDSGNNVVFYK